MSHRSHSTDYRDRLSPWCIVRLLPNAKPTIVARFRQRNSAEDCLNVLRRLMPKARFEIVFDPNLAAE